jgi:hypothetical protein
LTGSGRDANPAAGPLMNFAAHEMKFHPGGARIERSQLPPGPQLANFPKNQ